MLRQLIRVLLVALLSLGGTATQELWLLAFQPMTGGGWDAGISMQVGAEIMLREINANPSLLPGFELRIVWQDDLCDGSRGHDIYLQNVVWRQYRAFAPGKALDALDTDRDGVITTADVTPLEEVWNSSIVTSNPVGLLGPGCSGPSEKIAPMAAMARTPLISNGASRPSLSDRTIFPDFFRSIMPDSLFSTAWMAVTRDLGISSAILLLSDLGFASIARQYLDAARSQGVTLVGNEFDNLPNLQGFRGVQVMEYSRESAAQAGVDLVKYQQRIVVLNVYAKTARMVLCEAYQRNFENAVYMPFGWFAFGWWDVEDSDCPAEQIRGMAAGFIGAAQQYFRSDSGVQLSCSASMTARGFTDEFWRRQNTTPGDFGMQPEGFVPRAEATCTADAVCIFARALHEVIFTQGFGLSDLVDRVPAGYAAMLDAIAAADFEGVSGTIRFPPGSGDVQGTVLLTQLQYDAGGALKITEVATFRDRLNYLGKGDLVFQLPGEVFAAGPAGASVINASLAQFKTCQGSKVLDTRTNNCTDCPANTVRVAGVGQQCVCAAGFHETGSGCAPCPGGTFSASMGTVQCSMCGVGTFSSPGASQCSFCPRGRFADAQGMEVCHSCPPQQTTLNIASRSEDACICSLGAYRNGSGGCRSCPAGAITQGLDSPSVSSCLCPEHTYMNDLGCVPCPAGSLTQGGGKTNLTSCRCERDTYMSAAGVCSRCPSGSSTTGEGRQSVRSCLCREGTYMPLGAEGCLACPKGMLCPFGSNEANAGFITVVAKGEDEEFPQLQPRFWASLEDPMSVFKCRSELRCPGHRYPGDACAPNLQRQSCDSCIAGYHWDGQSCQTCSGFQGSAFYFPVLPLLIVPTALLVMYRFFGDTYEKWASWTSGVGTVAFVTLNHYQLVDYVINCNIPFPHFIKEFLGMWAITNNATAIFSLDCLGYAGIKSSIIVQGVVPVVIGAICVVLWGCSLLASKLRAAPSLAMDKNRLLNIYGSLMFTFVSAITALSLVVFKCTDNPNNTKSVGVDLSVVCFTSSEWQSLLASAVVLVLVYIISVYVIFLCTVIVAPRYFHDPGFQMRWKFLFIKYRVDAYWWSLVFLAQNILINLGFVVSAAGIVQLHLTTIVCFVYMYSVICVNPYRHRLANFLDIYIRATLIYTAALLSWYAERSQSGEWVSSAVDGTLVFLTSMPLVLALGASCHLWRFGRHFPAVQSERERAEKDFLRMVDNVVELSLLDTKEGANLILSLEEWDAWYLRLGMMAIHEDAMGVDSLSRVQDRTLSTHVLEKLMQVQASHESIEQAISNRVMEKVRSRVSVVLERSSSNIIMQDQGPADDTYRDPARDSDDAPDGTQSETSFGFNSFVI